MDEAKSRPDHLVSALLGRGINIHKKILIWVTYKKLRVTNQPTDRPTQWLMNRSRCPRQKHDKWNLVKMNFKRLVNRLYHHTVCFHFISSLTKNFTLFHSKVLVCVYVSPLKPKCSTLGHHEKLGVSPWVSLCQQVSPWKPGSVTVSACEYLGVSPCVTIQTWDCHKVLPWSHGCVTMETWVCHHVSP